MSEIQDLTSRVRELSESVDFWNLVMLWGLGIAAFAAALIGVSTRLVVVRTGEQAAAQGLLDTAKDRQLQADLKQKDLGIGTALADSAKALKAAAEANEKEEAERLARSRIEESLAWRRLDSPESKVLSSKVLKFKNMRASIFFDAGDAEGRTFAWDIAKALDSAQWKPFSPAGMQHMPPFGIPFGSADSKQKMGVEIQSTSESESKEAAETLVRALNALGFDSTLADPDLSRADDIVWVNVSTRPQGPQGKEKLK